MAAADYFGGPARDRGREIAAYEEFLTRYPQDYIVLNNAALRYDSRRAWAHAETLYRRSIEENPNNALAFGNLVRNLVSQGRLDEAEKLYADAVRRFANAPSLDGVRFPILLARGLRDSAAAEARALMASSRTVQNRARAATGLSVLSMIEGRLATAVKLRAETRAMNSSRGAAVSPLDEAIEAAWLDAWFREQPARAVRTLDSAVLRTPPRTLPVDLRNDFRLASAYAVAARPDRARAVLAQFDADIRDTTIRRFYEPNRHSALGEIAIAEGRPRDAIDEFRKSDVRPDGPVNDCAPCTDGPLARAFDLAGMPDSAIATFERYLATPYWFRYRPEADPTHLAGAYKRLGELYEAKGEKQKAASYYTKFVDLWKNADPELQPKVAEVKKRLAALSALEKR